MKPQCLPMMSTISDCSHVSCCIHGDDDESGVSRVSSCHGDKRVGCLISPTNKL